MRHCLDKINKEMRNWINGLMGRSSPQHCRGSNAVVWLRKFSNEGAEDCDFSLLDHVLATIPGVVAKRTIMGHTIQEVGINGVCDNRAIRIDVGMSEVCISGLPEVLEINKNSGIRVLTSNPIYQNNNMDADRMKVLDSLTQYHRPKQGEVKA